MDTEMSEDNSKPDSASVAEDKDDFQKAISTLDSVDEEKIDGSTLSTPIDEDSSQKKTGRKEAAKSTPANEDRHGDDISRNSVDDSPSTKQKRPLDEELSIEGIVFQAPGSDRLFIDRFDLSQTFFNLQTSMKQKKWKLSLEQNVHFALAATSILLITPSKYPEQLQQFFTEKEWAETSDRIQDLYGIKRKPMPVDTVSNMLCIIDNLMNKTINREEAVVSLMKLPLDEYEHKFSQALGGLILKLMRVPMDEDANETELCSRFIDPFLTGLLDAPDQGICLRWINDATLEAKTYADFTKNRPNLCITKCCGVKWKSSLAYGEVKPAIREKNHFSLCKDLLKVAVFCKDALDHQLMQGTLGIQITGRTIKFYLLTLPAKGLYVMIELATIKIPDSLQDLPRFVPELPNVLKILDVFHRVCVPVIDVASAKNRYTPTLPHQKFDQLFTISKDRKKPCHLKIRHN
ncbi:hypothetical protein G6F55_011713 [Rhizopus delemar]|nr:hypothetical protein G6F55_011713 [Rhizopus delemar]KAG1534220.1 hypothetical protein G6F51_012221 [Rhizopus arrhizus]KAG1487989.1 hypothetical protein G6F54_012326 [Rhizopus delemar]KAG1497167.1 hypothetical protein G6F53_012028 [Rhizopus delemar]KAG1511343.1 hypothetical protein G6F52_010674 [Rhizopus delemar]